ncbi:unannotated protein [freshwater metagenome]|uniref:Unannotated protein n=1 Tax=freshwater metagenome TaxID=449393 RepID=A0A6J6N6Q9_9ZZZZ
MATKGRYWSKTVNERGLMLKSFFHQKVLGRTALAGQWSTFPCKQSCARKVKRSRHRFHAQHAFEPHTPDDQERAHLYPAVNSRRVARNSASRSERSCRPTLDPSAPCATQGPTVLHRARFSPPYFYSRQPACQSAVKTRCLPHTAQPVAFQMPRLHAGKYRAPALKFRLHRHYLAHCLRHHDDLGF